MPITLTQEIEKNIELPSQPPNNHCLHNLGIFPVCPFHVFIIRFYVFAFVGCDSILNGLCIIT